MVNKNDNKNDTVNEPNGWNTDKQWGVYHGIYEGDSFGLRGQPSWKMTPTGIL